MFAQHERPASSLHAVGRMTSASTSGAAFQGADTCHVEIDTETSAAAGREDDYAAFVRRILQA